MGCFEFVNKGLSIQMEGSRKPIASGMFAPQYAVRISPAFFYNLLPIPQPPQTEDKLK